MWKRLTVGILAVWSLSVSISAQSPRMLVPAGDKVRETEVRLRFEANQLVIGSVADGDLKTLSYTQIKSAISSYSENPRRWKSGVVASVAAGPFALPVFFLKGKTHWLTVQTNQDDVVFRLDKSNYKSILSEFAARTGVKVEAANREVKAVARLDVGEGSRVTVQLRDRTTVKGNVTHAGDDTFVIRNGKNQDKTISYGDVVSLTNDLSAGADIAIGLSVGWCVFLTVANFFI